MKPSEMTTVELLEKAAERIDCGAGAFAPEGCDMKPPCQEFSDALRFRAARLREALESVNRDRSHQSIPDGIVQDCLRTINAPSTPIAKDQP